MYFKNSISYRLNAVVFINIRNHCEFFAIENAVREVLKPIAQNNHLSAWPNLALHHQMAVTVNHIVEMFVFEQFFRVNADCLLLIAQIMSQRAAATARVRPLVTKPHTQIGMKQIGKHKFYYLVMEQPFDKLVRPVARANAVAVRDVETLAHNLGFKRIVVDYHSYFVAKVAEGPSVVVASKKMHFDATFDHLRQLAQRAHKAHWHNR